LKNSGSDFESSPSQGADNIMRQLHASDSHGVERRREVVVRPDGSKVIRVEKRRRTYSDDQREPNRAMLKNKRFLIGLCILVLLVAGALAGTYMYRLTSFNTEEFAGRLQADLSAAWGGDVKISGMAVDGLTMKASRIRVSFPEDSCLSFVAMEGISGEISAVPLFMGKIKGESLNVSRAVVGLRPGFVKFAVPQTNRELPFVFRRYTAPRLEVGYAHGAEEFTLERNGAPFYMTAEAYIRTSGNGPEPEYVLDLSQQKLKIKGWPLMGVDSGSVILNGSGVKQLTFSGFLDKGRLLNKPTDLSPFMITGNFLLGTDFRHQAWTLTGKNFDLASLLGDDFSSLLKVQTGEQEGDEKHELKLDFALPVTTEQKRPSLKGYSGSVIKATMIRLPVLRLLAAMTARNTEIRLPYSSPVFTSGSFLLESDGTGRSASLKEISLFEQGFLGVTGVLYSNGTSLTGKLVFKIPSYMVDGRKLPSGVTQEGHEMILPVKISGTPESPQDNSAGMFREEAPRTGRPEMHTAPSRGIDLPVPSTSSPSRITVDGFM
jgi:hypothetical protein